MFLRLLSCVFGAVFSSFVFLASFVEVLWALGGRRPACLYIAFAAVHGLFGGLFGLCRACYYYVFLGAPASLLFLCVRPGSRSGGLCARVITMCFLCSEGLRRGFGALLLLCVLRAFTARRGVSGPRYYYVFCASALWECAGFTGFLFGCR